MGPACVAARREPFVLPERVLDTMAEARAPSSRRLYTLKWSIFSAWCQDRDIDPVTSNVSVVLSFLQEMLDKQRSSSTIKVYTAAIAAFHAPIAGRSVGRDSEVIQFQENESSSTLRLTKRTKGPKGPQFEPLQFSSLRVLLVKTALLLALASVKRVGDLQALSVNPACLEFGPNDSKVVLKPRLGYVPKVLSTPFRAQVIALPCFLPRRAARNPCSAPSGPWKYTLSVLPRTESQNSFLLASVTALKVALLRSREFLGGLWMLSHFFILHEPITCSYNCVIQIGFSWRGKIIFPIQALILDAVLAPISQGTEVTIVTEYVILTWVPCFYSTLWDTATDRNSMVLYVCLVHVYI